jgi:hypothetical protein
MAFCILAGAAARVQGQTEANWIGVDGVYSDAGQWNTNPDVPCNNGTTYDVTINVANADVSFDLPACSVSSFMLGGTSTLTVLKGMSYTVLGEATISGALTAAAGGAVFADMGVTTINNSNLYAYAGGTLNLTGATNYTHAGGNYVDKVLQADGGGSVLNLSSVTSLAGGPSTGAELFIQALEGGQVNLSAATDVTAGAAQILANGPGSVVDITAMTTFNDTNGNATSSIRALDGGTVLMPNLADLNAVNLTLDGTGTLSTNQIQFYNNGSVTATGVTADFSGATDVSGSSFDVTGGLLSLPAAANISAASIWLRGGATADLSSAATINNASFYVYDGVTLAAPLATGYLHTGGNYVDRILQADGAGSVLDLSFVTSITGSGSTGADLFIQGLEGGSIDLGGVTEVSGGAAQILATGVGSVVDISVMTTFNDTNGNTTSSIQALDGGAVLMPLLTDLNGVNLTLDGTGALPTAQIVYYNNGTVTATEVAADFSNAVDVSGSAFNITGGSVDLSSVDNLSTTSISLSGGATALLGPSNIDNASFYVHDGVTISLPNAISYLNTAGNYVDRYLQADGGGSVLSLPAVGTITGSGSTGADLFIQALEGGQVNLGAATDMTGGAAQVLANGPGSVVDISAMTTFNDTNGNTTSSIRALDGGTVLMPMLTDLNAVDLTIDGTGTLSTSQIEYYNNGTVTATTGTADFSSTIDIRGSIFNLGGGTTPALGAANIDNVNFYVSNGVTASLPNATSYSHTGGNYADKVLEADGGGSVLGLLAVGSIHSSNSTGAELFVQALDGGRVDLGAATEMTSGAMQILADGANSVVDISAMTTFNDTNGSSSAFSYIQALEGGAVLAANLQDIEQVKRVRADGEDSLIDLSALVNFVSASASLEAINGATLLAGSLEQLNGVSVTLSGPSEMTLGNPVVMTGASFNHEGGTLTGSVTLVNSNLNNGPGGTGAAAFAMHGDCALSGDLAMGQSVRIEGGGFGAANATSAAGFVNSGLITLESINGGLSSNLFVQAGVLENASTGEILINAGTGGDRTLEAELDNRGTFSVTTSDNKFIAIGKAGANHTSSGSFTVNGTELDYVAIIGDSFTNLPGGIFAGVGTVDVQGIPGGLSSEGFLRPGASPGTLQLIGDYAQTAGGTLEIELGGAPASGSFDVLSVSGTATLAGAINVTTIDAYVPAIGDSFEILTAAAVSGVFDDEVLPTLPAAMCWDLAYDATSVTLSVLGSAITQQPVSQTVCEGETAVFAVIVDGNLTPTYQWQKERANILGATDSTYTIDQPGVGDAGSYEVIVTNSCGEVTSASAVLTVNTAPSITQEPTDEETCEGEGATFTVIADGVPAPSFEWRWNGAEIPGATDSTYALDTVTPGDAGDYDVVVTNVCGTATSVGATLTVNTAPTITLQPTGETVCEGEAVTFTASADGVPAPTFQWRKNGSDIPLATDNAYMIDPVTGADAGDYDVMVTNGCGWESSAAATLVVLVPGPGDLDVDCDIDLYDYESFEQCLAGPVGGRGSGCVEADLDNSGNVDLRDVAKFQSVFTGE